jgi:hypothetical protein
MPPLADGRHVHDTLPEADKRASAAPPSAAQRRASAEVEIEVEELACLLEAALRAAERARG